MRLDRGANGDLRQSALWGKPSKGETRSSALWGKPGRGFVSLVVVALALTASTAASASSRYVYTTPGLLTSAKVNPSQTFNVIIQGDADKTTGAIASVVRTSKSGEAAWGIKAPVRLGERCRHALTARPPHRPRRTASPRSDGLAGAALGSFSNKQRWPFIVRRPEVLGEWDMAATPTIAVVDSGIDASRPDFGGRVVTGELTAGGNSADARRCSTFVAGSRQARATATPARRPPRSWSIDVMDDQGWR
jgi:hypothetical protein